MCLQACTGRRPAGEEQVSGGLGQLWTALTQTPALHASRARLNPLTLREAKRGLTILEIFNLQTHFLENI